MLSCQALFVTIFLTGPRLNATLSGMKLSPQMREHYRKLGRLGSSARNKKLSPARRKEIAQNAANTRWKANREEEASLTHSP